MLVLFRNNEYSLICSLKIRLSNEMGDAFMISKMVLLLYAIWWLFRDTSKDEPIGAMDSRDIQRVYAYAAT
jgi:hypothetical protein